MSLLDNILESIGVTCLPKEQNYRYTVLGGSAGYFENISGIKYYTTEEIALSLKHGGLTVRGDNLYVKKFCAGDVVICGNILSVEKI